MNSLVLFVFLLVPTSAAITGFREEIACEDFLIKLSCPQRHTVVVVDAQYGRQNSNFCIPDTKTCEYNGVSNILDKACAGKEDCTFAVQSSAFGGDQCPGTTKYLIVQYQCVRIY